MKIRVCFEKTEAGRYLSHLDMARTMERSLRRAKAPIAFSEGFNPHVKMAFAHALAVGTTGKREYMDVNMASRVNIKRFYKDLEDVFPPALALVAAEEIMEGGRSLTALINLAIYRVTAVVPKDEAVKVAEGVAKVLAAKELWRKAKEKPGKKAIPPKEVRGLVRRLEIVGATAGKEADAGASIELGVASGKAAGSEEVSASGKNGHSAQGGEGAAADTLENTGVSDALAVTADTASDSILILEMELLLKPDGQLSPKELWEMIAEAGGFAPARLLTVSREALLILQDGKVFAP